MLSPSAGHALSHSPKAQCPSRTSRQMTVEIDKRRSAGLASGHGFAIRLPDPITPPSDLAPAFTNLTPDGCQDRQTKTAGLAPCHRFVDRWPDPFTQPKHPPPTLANCSPDDCRDRQTKGRRSCSRSSFHHPLTKSHHTAQRPSAHRHQLLAKRMSRSTIKRKDHRGERNVLVARSINYH